MDSLLNGLFAQFVEPIIAPRIRAGSIHAVKGYVQFIAFARAMTGWIFGIGIIAAILMTGMGLAIMGIVGLFPIEPQALALTALILGAVMIIVATVTAIVFFRQSRWLRISKSYDMIAAVTAPWPTMMPPNPMDVMRSPAATPDLGPQASPQMKTAEASTSAAMASQMMH